LGSPEPVRRVLVQSQDEERVPVPRKASHEPHVVEKDNARDVVTEGHQEAQEAVSTPTPQPSPLKLNFPPSPTIETASSEEVLFVELKEENQAPAISKTPAVTTSQPCPPILPPIRAVFSASSDGKPGSRGSSLKQISTKATTPPQSPVEAEEKPVLSARAYTPEKVSPEPKTDEASPTPTEAEPVPKPQPVPTQAEVQPTDLKTIEAFSTTPFTETKSILDLNTGPQTQSLAVARRPSYESDTPLTPPVETLGEIPTLTTTTTTDTLTPSNPGSRPVIARPSTAPVEPPLLTRNKAQRRKSRLSRFLSTSERKEVQISVKEVHLPVMGEGEEGEEEEAKEKSSWEREVEEIKVEGRKWREEGDNESLFCY